MARLRVVSDSESDSDFDIAILAKKTRGAPPARQRIPSSSAKNDLTVQKTDISTLNERSRAPSALRSVSSNSSSSVKQSPVRLQRPLGITQANPLLRPISDHKSKYGEFSNIDLPGTKNSKETRQSPRKPTKPIIRYDLPESALEATGGEVLGREPGEGFSDFIVNDSASETELRRPVRQLKVQPASSPRKVNRRRVEDTDSSDDEHIPTKQLELVVLDSPDNKALKQDRRSTSTSSNAHNLSKQALEEFFDEPGAHLKFSPPRARPRTRKAQDDNFVTPPSSPTKSRLQSPSKFRPKIPQTPHRPSIDAFWSQEITNDWNDKHSPQRPPQTTKGLPQSSIPDDADFPSPCTSPRKSPLKASPQKKDKAALEAKKSFDTTKDALARAFLAQLDEAITAGRITQLAAATGGVQIRWSKTLQSTAGRANWKRETVRSTSSGSTANTAAVAGAVSTTATTTTTHFHPAAIDLALKIITTPQRLRNTLAHEFCHLATFMISGVKDRPHGAEFKAWAAKASRAFGNRGGQVTTKHSYEIEYKYVWRCGECGLEYKRHSKSIDVAKSRCGGGCGGALVQVRPVPRKGAAGAKGKGEGEGEYQGWVKGNYGRVREELRKGGGKVGMTDIMAVLAREYREMKAKGGDGEAAGQDNQKRKGDVVDLVADDDEADGHGDVQLIVVDSEDETGLDKVAWKLGTLELNG